MSGPAVQCTTGTPALRAARRSSRMLANRPTSSAAWLSAGRALRSPTTPRWTSIVSTAVWAGANISSKSTGTRPSLVVIWLSWPLARLSAPDGRYRLPGTRPLRRHGAVRPAPCASPTQETRRTLTSRASARAPAADAHVARAGSLHHVAAAVAVRRVALLGPGERCGAGRGGCGRHAGRGRAALPRAAAGGGGGVDDPHRGRRALLHAGQGRLGPLGRRQHPQLGPLLEAEVVEREAAEDVVDQARGDPQVGVVGDPRRLEAHVRVLPDVGGERHAVLEPEADRDREGIHDARQGGALLGDLDEHLARPAVLVLPDGHVPLAVRHTEGEGVRPPAPRQPLADG